MKLKKLLKDRWIEIISITGVSLLLLIYITYKAIHLPVVHDESYTLLHFVNLSFDDIINYRASSPANNHILNSLLIKACVSIFGLSEFIMRAPNVIAYFFYALFSASILIRNFKSKLLVIGGFLLLNLNPFLIDFFSLARGYGLALAFTMIGLFFYLESLNKLNFRKRLQVIAFIAFCFAVLSNLVFLNMVLALIAGMFVAKIFRDKKKVFNIKFLVQEYIVRHISVFVIMLVLLIGTLPVFKLLRDRDQLYFGGVISFWTDTVVSLIDSFIYFNNYSNFVIDLIKFVIIFTTFIGIILLFENFREKKLTNSNYKFIAIFSALLVALVGSIIQFYLMDTRFLMERTAILFYALFIFTLLFIIDHLTTLIPQVKNYSMITFFIIVGFVVINAYSSYNLQYTYTFRYDADTKKVLNEILENDRFKNDDKTVLLTDGTLLSSFFFYDYYENLKTMDYQTIDDPNMINWQEVDFIYVREESFNAFDENIAQNFDILEIYNTTNNLLAVRKI